MVVCATSYVDVGVLECTKYVCPEIINFANFFGAAAISLQSPSSFELPMLLVILVFLGLKLYV